MKESLRLQEESLSVANWDWCWECYQSASASCPVAVAGSHSDTAAAAALSCPRQECHAGKTARVTSDRKTDLRMTLMSLIAPRSVGHEQLLNV